MPGSAGAEQQAVAVSGTAHSVREILEQRYSDCLAPEQGRWTSGATREDVPPTTHQRNLEASCGWVGFAWQTETDAAHGK